MVVIRLSRSGAKKNPFYKVVATDKRSPRDGRFIEIVGTYNPVARGQEKELNLKLDRINYWIATGAQCSETVARLVKYYQKQTADNTQG
jgi:small subunit ribosomal protein S16